MKQAEKNTRWTAQRIFEVVVRPVLITGLSITLIYLYQLS